MYLYESSNELYHYGVLGMKWGVRKATYRTLSVSSLAKSAKNVKKDIRKLESKKARQDRKAAKAMSKGKIKKAGKHMKKSYKREKTIIHNKKLLDAYDKRISKLDPKTKNVGEDFVKNKISNRKTSSAIVY